MAGYVWRTVALRQLPMLDTNWAPHIAATRRRWNGDHADAATRVLATSEVSVLSQVDHAHVSRTCLTLTGDGPGDRDHSGRVRVPRLAGRLPATFAQADLGRQLDSPLLFWRVSAG